MNFEEYAGKPVLAEHGIAIPDGRLARTPDEAAAAQIELGPVVVKAQVPTGKRGKAGGIKIADTPEDARAAAEAILGMDIGGNIVKRLLVEGRQAIAREFYAAVLNDPVSKGPMVLFSALGGMDVEEAAEQDADAVRRQPVDIRVGLEVAEARAMLAGLDIAGLNDDIADILVRLYGAYRAVDAELLEINPLALLDSGELLALDCKFVMDDSGIKRQQALAEAGTPDKLTGLEAEGEAKGLKYIELEGDVGVLANGAGLTMTTMDVVRHHGGVPANFLEIGGEAYTKGTDALRLVLENPKIKSLVINFCGAFARTDVMTDGILTGWEELKPDLPVFWSVHGTGDVEAVAMLKDRLGVEPLPTMDEACKAAVNAAKEASQ